MALRPRAKLARLDGLDQPLDRHVALQDQAGIQADLRAVGETAVPFQESKAQNASPLPRPC